MGERSTHQMSRPTTFSLRSENLHFEPFLKQQTDDGYCVDIKCVNDSILRKFKAQRKKNEKAKLDEDSAEHKFTGPKREPTIVENSPPKRIEKLPGEPIIKKGTVFARPWSSYSDLNRKK